MCLARPSSAGVTGEARGTLSEIPVGTETLGAPSRHPVLPSMHQRRHPFYFPRLAVLLSLGAASLSAGCGQESPAEDPGYPIPAPPEPVPVTESGAPADLIVLISLDTLRADHLSVYGYDRPTSPELETFAEHATLYTRCQATSPWTLPSHASMFTGLYSFEHGARTYPREMVDQPRRFSNTIPLPERYVTLAERLRDCGYRTGSVSANEGFLTERYGLNQGFEHWDNRDARVSGINARALKWLLEQPKDEKVFLFLNYMDTHRPYNNAPRANIPHHEDHGLAELAAKILGEEEYDRDQIQVLIDVYDTAVANLDEGLGVLFDKLREFGYYERALILITSDHGEFLGEHELMDHAKDVYQGVAHVPLLVKAPGQSEAFVDDGWISLVHVPELVLQHTRGCGAEGVDGRQRESVLTELYGPRPRQKLGIWRFKRVRRALTHGNYKFVESSDDHHELYDLNVDPGELDNLLADEPELGKQLAAQLEGYYGDIQWPEELNFVEITDDDLEVMRHLGYVGGDEEEAVEEGALEEGREEGGGEGE